ncbi:protein NRT1/ PTR FAMILY 5.10-like [Papaver somniferum]|uniref:protein NRT1/ PTR FAMILY 5.10-like n=1 Tax=Papaver somniferum TaxID=3469 RepID=UPI000E7026AF|nr:protein NRT1/ PTR FAMILY 5.10-like [Papaver somniferum]
MGKSGPGVMDYDQRYKFLLSHGRSNIEFGGGSYMRIVGGWRPAKFILAAETLETIAIYGVASNLMTYLTGPLHQSTATSAININVWSAVVWVLPLVGAFVADTYLGRFRTIKISSFIYLVVNISLYEYPVSTIFRLIFIFIQENWSWGVGFGLSLASMVVASVIFTRGTYLYRFSPVEEDKQNPLSRVLKVYMAAAKNWRSIPSAETTQAVDEMLLSNDEIRGGAHQLRFLDKALLADDISTDQVEDAREVLSLVPLWITLLMYGVVSAQPLTFFTKQGSTMMRSVSSFEIPAASMITIYSFSVVLFIPIYDRFVVPLAQHFTGKPNGITILQRMCIGLVLSIVSMMVAAIVERKRLRIAFDSGLIDMPHETIPMSIWWLAPQYILIGVAEDFTVLGMRNFFRDQLPDRLKNLDKFLFLSALGVGELLSGFVVFAIEKLTNASSQSSWFSENLNRAHLDYFYWLLSGLGAVNLVAYIYASKIYIYKTGTSVEYVS